MVNFGDFGASALADDPCRRTHAAKFEVSSNPAASKSDLLDDPDSYCAEVFYTKIPYLWPALDRGLGIRAKSSHQQTPQS